MIAVALVAALIVSGGQPTGCRKIPAADVVEVQSGFVILSTQDLVWYDAIHESGDLEFWGCWSRGKLDRFFVPQDHPKRPAPDGTPYLRSQPHD